ncbi:hypothetical protein LFLT20_20560 [Limosilactobacillus fermentum]|nr:hypothetical protein LFLT20_20560 [Limosilactobacillus fermentum]
MDNSLGAQLKVGKVGKEGLGPKENHQKGKKADPGVHEFSESFHRKVILANINNFVIKAMGLSKLADNDQHFNIGGAGSWGI